MTYAAVGSDTGGAAFGAFASFSLTTNGVGNFVLAEVYNEGNTRTPTALSSSNCTWTALGTSAATSVGITAKFQVFLGVVTSASTATVTITWGAGSAGTSEGVAAKEFSTTTGTPVLDVQGTLNSGGTNTWASLTPAAAGELYFGFAMNTAGATSGSTSGYSYNPSIDTHSNGMAYNVNCSGSAQAPVWGDSTEAAGIMVLVMPGTVAAGGGGPFVPWQYRPHAAPGEPFTPWPPWDESTTPPAAAVPPEQLLPPPGSRAAAPHRARLGRAATVAAGILAATTLSPQPASVPPSRPGPVIGHPAPHRAIGKGVLAPPQRPALTAKLPPTAISPRPPHRAVVRWVLAKTTLSPQPSSVPPPQWRQPNAPRPAHRAVWDALPGPPPSAVVVTAVPPSHPQPVTNRPAAPHRAIVRGVFAPAPAPYLTAKLPPSAVSRRTAHRAIPVGDGILAVTTFSPQPTRVPPPAWRQPNAPRPAHRAAWRAIAGPAPAVVTVTGVPPARPAPVTNRLPAPHRAVVRWVLAKTTLSPQPSSVPPARPQPTTNRPPPPHRGAWRAVAGLPPAVVPAVPSRPRPITNRPPAPHRALIRILAAKTTLSPQPSRVTGPQWRQPFAPRPAHRAIWRAVAGAAPPPPPFTIGALTAADTPRAVLTAGDAGNALTALTAPSGALTAGDQRTGGPN